MARRGYPGPEEVWWTGMRPDLSHPMAKYTIMIRSDVDPARSSREELRRESTPRERSMQARQMKKWPPEAWRGRVEELLSDGEPRTFNAIAVELVDKTANIMGGSGLEEALWQLVDAEQVAFTMDAPIFFMTAARLRGCEYCRTMPGGARYCGYCGEQVFQP